MLKKILVTLLFTFTFSHALEEINIKSTMDIKIKKVINVLQNKSLSQTQKNKNSIAIFDPVFDYALMAKISLGKKWNSLTKQQKSSFTKAFEHKVKYSYIDKLKLYTNQKIVTKNIKKVKHNRITLETRVVSSQETYKIINSFYKKKSNQQWYIYDVRLAGVSIIQTYRKQFSAYLKTKTFESLLKSL
ncbi:MAG: ABC transporter substrate-binding protein [Campylobacterota bacterium]|nr:ABC transporter substrate-binding protein [Campylobacterota bacterium]